MAGRNLPLAERLFEKVEKIASGCWEWKFGVCHNTIYYARKGSNWKHLAT